VSVLPIGALPGLGGLTALPSLPGVAAPSEAGGGFGQLVTDRLEALQGLHKTSDDFAVQAATGDLKDVHDYMIAASRARSPPSSRWPCGTRPSRRSPRS
jgi:flagellar hook-basal body complex protein FliE